MNLRVININPFLLLLIKVFRCLKSFELSSSSFTRTHISLSLYLSHSIYHTKSTFTKDALGPIAKEEMLILR